MHKHTIRQNTTASDGDLIQLIEQRKLSILNPKVLYDQTRWRKLIQPSSLDLHLGGQAWIMEGSIRPRENETVEDLIKGHSVKEINLEDGAEFVQGKTYIIKLQEAADLPPFARLRANPKSSTGRSDAQARLLTDGNPHYETVTGPYCGKMYLELVPSSFDLILRTGDALNQIRYSIGNPVMPDDEIASVLKAMKYGGRSFIYSKDGKITPPDKIKIDGGIVLTADLEGGHTNSEVIAYRAKKNCPLPVDFQGVGKHHLHKYFDTIEKPRNKELELESGYFYLLSTNEAVSLLPSFAAELSQFDHRAGNVTWHYAGFFDPGWGYFQDQEQQGNTITLEARVHNKAEIIRHGQPIGVMRMERMSSEPLLPYGEKRSSNHTRQIGVRYGKHFFE